MNLQGKFKDNVHFSAVSCVQYFAYGIQGHKAGCINSTHPRPQNMKTGRCASAWA